MTTITALNVRLGMDVSNFSEGANLAKGEVSKVATIMRQSVPPAEKFKQELGLLNRAFSESGKKSVEYANAVEHLKRKHEQAAPAIRDVTKASKEAGVSSSSAIASIKGMAAAYLSVQTVAKSINLASQVEDATIAFEVLTGSAKDGQLLFEQIRKFAAESPVTFSNAADATKTMMSFGVAAQDVQKNLQMLSDVTGGNNDRFKMLSLAFSQTTAAGRLMGQDLLQMINAGFNPLQQISKTTGETMIELKKRMEDGGISSQEVRQAFEDATSAGGMFHGMTERLAGTVSGKLNIALSDLEQKAASAGQAMGPLLIQLLDTFTRLKPILDAVINLIDGISQGLGFAIAVVTDLINSVKNFTVDTTEMNKFLDLLEQREREAAFEKEKRTHEEFQQKKTVVNEVAIAERKAAEQAHDSQMKAIEDQKKAKDDWFKEQKQKYKDEQQMYKKAAEDRKKEREQAARQVEEQFQRDMETARKAAMDYFAQQEEKNKQRRADVAAGPGAGMEVGSAEAAKFSADQINRQMSVAAVPDQPTPGEVQIAWKAEQLFKEQQAANALATRQIAIMDSLLREAKENGFRRIR
jgi:tape measure domain-containing protein